MCGFVILLKKKSNTPWWNKKISRIFSDLSKINKHRGPDTINIKNTKKYSAIARRLQIYDSSTEANLLFTNKNKKIKIYYNGSIYNFLELKEELIKYGHKFKTKLDTEVIIKCYEQFGLKFIKKIRGMFSLVIFDDNLKKIFLFRDPLGQKPLYYCKIKIGFVISSEIKDILYIKKQSNEKNLENDNTVFKYLLRGWTDDTNQTFYKNILSFPAGSYGEVNSREIKIKKYWNLKIGGNKIFNSEVFKSKFSNIIKEHTHAETKSISLTLSGGIDSSAIARQLSQIKDIKFKAFSIKFRDNNSDEANKINTFVKENKINHEFCHVEKSYNSELLSQVIDAHDEPIKDMSFINQFILRKFIYKNGYKVVITGEGADEALAGYERMLIPFLYEKFINKNIDNSEAFKNYIKKYTKYDSDYYLKKIKNLKYLDNDIESIEPLNFLKNNKKNFPNYLKFYNKTTPNKVNFFKRFLTNHLFKKDLPSILRHDDRNSMNFSIENRTPFIDSKFLEYIFSHDYSEFIRNGKLKYMLSNSLKIFSSPSYSKKSFGRPGFPEVLIKKSYIKKMNYLLKGSPIKNFSNKKILKQFNFDLTKSNSNNFIFYFRILNYLLWRSKNLN